MQYTSIGATTTAAPYEEVMELISPTAGFQFIDEILELNDQCIRGTYTYRQNEFDHHGYLSESPTTPGVVLTEIMAQIGLLAFGMHLYLQKAGTRLGLDDIKVRFTQSKINFLNTVMPGEKVWVNGEKESFHNDTLQCWVSLKKEDGEVVCQGTLAGIFLPSE